jgi:hypothetical protein
MSNETTIIGIGALGIGALIAIYFGYYSYTYPTSRDKPPPPPPQEFTGDEDQVIGPNIPGAPGGTMSSFYGTGRKHKKTKKIKRNHKKQKSIKNK